MIASLSAPAALKTPQDMQTHDPATIHQLIKKTWGSTAMIDRQTVIAFLRLNHEGLSIRKISAALCLSRKTVVKDIDNPNPQRDSQKRASKLDPFKEEIARLLQTDPKVSAVVIKQRLDPLGFNGGISILKDYLRAIRPVPANRTPYIRFETAPDTPPW